VATCMPKRRTEKNVRAEGCAKRKVAWSSTGATDLAEPREEIVVVRDMSMALCGMWYNGTVSSTPPHTAEHGGWQPTDVGIPPSF